MIEIELQNAYNKTIVDDEDFHFVSNSKCNTDKTGHVREAKRSGKSWQAHITVNKKFINLGSFKNEKDAAIAYDKAALNFYGEFYSPNFSNEIPR